MHAHAPSHTWHLCCRRGGLAVPQLCHVPFQIRHREDGLPLAHVAIAVEGPGWAHPDNVALQVANAVIGHYDCTYGGGAVSGRRGPRLGGGAAGRRRGPRLGRGAAGQRRDLDSGERGSWAAGAHPADFRGGWQRGGQVLTTLAPGSTCPAHWLPSLRPTSCARVSRPSTSATQTLGCWARTSSATT